MSTALQAESQRPRGHRIAKAATTDRVQAWEVRSEQSRKISASNSNLLVLESNSSDDISWKQSRVRKINALQWLGSSYIWCFYIFHWMIQTSFTGVLSVLQHLLWHCVSNFSIPIPRARIPCFNMFGLYPRMPEVQPASWLEEGRRERVGQKIMSTLHLTAMRSL